MDVIGKTLGNILGKKRQIRSGGKDPRKIELAGRRGKATIEDVYGKLQQHGHLQPPEQEEYHDFGMISQKGVGNIKNIPVKYEYFSAGRTGGVPSLDLTFDKPSHKKEIMKNIHLYGWKGNVPYGQDPKTFKTRR